MKVKFGFYDIAGGHQKQAGESPFDSVIITKWHKRVGDVVESGEPIFCFETDKIDADFESLVSGIIIEIREKYSKGGSSWQVGVDTELLPDGRTLFLPHLGIIETEGMRDNNFGNSGTEELEKRKKIIEDSEDSNIQDKRELERKFTPVAWKLLKSQGFFNLDEFENFFPRDKKIRKKNVEEFFKNQHKIKMPENAQNITVPAARKLAREAGFDISKVTGTGDGGLILVQDVEQHFTQIKGESEEQEELEDRVPLGASRLRKTIARFMSRSHREIPQYGGSMLIDVTKLRKFRETNKISWRRHHPGTSLRYDYIFGFLAVKLLAHKKFRILNAYWDQDKQEIYLFNDVNLGFAVETGETEKDPFGGLMVPVVHRADKMSLAELVQSAEDKIIKVKAGDITLPELKDLTFTINNIGGKKDIKTNSILEFIENEGIFGASGISHSAVPYTNDTSIGERPTGMILVLGEIFWHEDQAHMWISFRFDHRLTDGGPPRRFVSALKKYIESKGNSDDFVELLDPEFVLK